MLKENYDVIVAGAGPSGLTAAIQTSRLGLRTLVLETERPGGRAAQAAMYENFPGFPDGITGNELVTRMLQQVSRFGADLRDFEEVMNIEVTGQIKKVTTKKSNYNSHALIIATGTQRKKLRVPGENELLGKGVSYCRACDGPFFKDLRVAVVGSTEEAARDSLFLAGVAEEVLWILGREKVEIDQDLKREITRRTNIRVVQGIVTAILGENKVDAVEIMQLKSKINVREEIDGVFIVLGWVPTTELVRKAGVETDGRGCIIVDRWQRTNIEGVFATGDCTCGGMQIVTAAGEGAMAAIKAVAYVERKRKLRKNDS
ncbi:MAG: FAD-dependent oxidoreductase [Candidatus Bathyarchaeota archaeon]|nr:FAD-dependent oxidoreductase [Candidatus Bathyarchaeota archaeon]